MGLDYIELTRIVSKASKDPRYQVGAMIVDTSGDIVSTGYNGAPRRVKDNISRYHKPLKDFYIVHAEANAIFNAARKGASTNACIMYIWGKAPCAHCAGAIIQAGIFKVYYQPTILENSNWKESCEAAQVMFEEAGIITELYYLPMSCDPSQKS